MDIFVNVDFRAIEERLLKALRRGPRPSRASWIRAINGAHLALQLHEDGTYEVLKSRTCDLGYFEGTVFASKDSVMMGTITGRTNVFPPNIKDVPKSPVTFHTKDYMQVGDSVYIDGETYTVKRIVSPRHVVLTLGNILTFVYLTSYTSRIVWNVLGQRWNVTGGVLHEVLNRKPSLPARRVTGPAADINDEVEDVADVNDEVGYLVFPDEVS